MSRLPFSSRIRTLIIKRIYLVAGEQTKYLVVSSDQSESLRAHLEKLRRSAPEYKEPGYSTDPDSYGLDVWDSPAKDEVERAEKLNRVKVFLNWDDAIDFAHHCNLDSVVIQVYERFGKKWRYSSRQTVLAVDSMNW